MEPLLNQINYHLFTWINRSPVLLKPVCIMLSVSCSQSTLMNAAFQISKKEPHGYLLLVVVFSGSSHFFFFGMFYVRETLTLFIQNFKSNLAKCSVEFIICLLKDFENQLTNIDIIYWTCTMWQLPSLPKEQLYFYLCYFQTVVLEKTLGSPLDSKEIKPVNPKWNQPWIFIGRTDAGAEATWCEKLDNWKRLWCWER